MAFWEPGMPAKGFDPFNIERVKADLEDGSCLEFPIEDYYEYLDPAVRTSDYLLNYKISFKDNNSFGKNVDNYIEFDVFVSNCEIFSIIHQIRYL